MIRDYLLLIVIFVLTVIMGYFLGLMVSSTVDYRLKDIVVNLPRPKTNVFLNDKIVDKSKQKIIKNNDTTDNHIDYQEKKKKSDKKQVTNKKLSKNIPDKKENIDDLKQRVESFTSIINKLTDKIKSKSNYTHVFEDKNMIAYSELFTNNKDSTKDDDSKFSFTPFNAEESNQIYTSLS